MNKSVKILTLNIRNPSFERANKLIEWLKNRPEDIFVLTETKNSTGCNHIADLFSKYALGLLSQQKEIFVSFPKSLSGDYGVMCISKYPIKKSSSPYSNNSQFYCRHLENDISIDSKLLHIVGLYVPSRNQSIEKINRKKDFLKESLIYIKDIKNPSTIICGDFNLLDRNHFPHYSFFKEWEYAFYENLLQNGYVDAFKHCYPKATEYSWVGRTNDGYRYDYCFVSKSLENRILNCEFIHETRTSHLTDHSALSIEIQYETIN